MLEIGPLVGMVQIPGIKYGVKDVITLATLNGAIEDILDIMRDNGIESLNEQTEFIAQCLSAWFEASGRFEDPKKAKRDALNPQNVAYQGRILVSVIALIPAMIWKLNQKKLPFISNKAGAALVGWLSDIAERANLLEKGIFISKDRFKERGYLGSGGIGRFRSSLWAVVTGKTRLNKKMRPEKVAALAEKNQSIIFKGIK